MLQTEKFIKISKSLYPKGPLWCPEVPRVFPTPFFSLSGGWGGVEVTVGVTVCIV